MGEVYVVIGAVTTTTRLAELLDRFGINKNKIVRTPNSISSGGCSYAIKMQSKYIGKVTNIAEEFEIKIKGIYSERSTTGGTEYDKIYWLCGNKFS